MTLHIRGKPGTYDWRWQKFRAWYLSRHPVCKGCDRAANEVDHIQPLNSGGEKYDLENLQPLCKPCHSRKTRAENGRPGKAGCDVNGFPVLPG